MINRLKCILLAFSVSVLVFPLEGQVQHAVNEHEVIENSTVVLRLSDYQGEFIQWQHSVDMVIWMNVPGSSADTLMFVAVDNRYLRARVIAGNCDPFYSEVTRIVVTRLSTLTTRAAFNITRTSASAGGEITDGGGTVVTARGVVWGTFENPTLENNEGLTQDGTGAGEFTSELTGLTPETTYYVRAYATNSVGTAYGDEVSFETPEEDEEIFAPAVTTAAVTGITQTTAISGGEVTGDGGAAVTVRGIVWSTDENPSLEAGEHDGFTEDGDGTGEFTSELTALAPGTAYYVRAYATNSAGTSYGEQNGFITLDDWPTDTETEVVEVTNPATGRVWMDRNLGASRAASIIADEEAYGHLYQWGRAADGHQIRTSDRISILSNSDTPGHGDFISPDGQPWDWRSPQNDNLWQGINGINNPCPAGFRLPTEAEWEEELFTWNSNNREGAFASRLKLPVAGGRLHSDGSFLNFGTGGFYWSSTLHGSSARALFIGTTAIIASDSRAHGFSVRCLKDPGASYILSLLVNPSGSGEVSGAGYYTEGATVSITAAANEGYRFVNWTLAEGYGSLDDLIGAGNNEEPELTFSMPDGNLRLTANFDIAHYILTISVNDEAMGEVRDNQEEVFTGGAFKAGDEILITALPNEGYQFVNWTLDAGAGAIGDYIGEGNAESEVVTVIMPAYEISLTANFVGDWPTDTETEIVDVINPLTGKMWMDRNLGASRAATSSADEESYGHLYQWGRAADGHQIRSSGTTSTLSSSDTPGHGDFILVPNSPFQWRSPENNNLWQGVDGINNPCPVGYRLPTAAELEAELQSWISSDSTGAFASPLKLPLSGYRSHIDGIIHHVGSRVYYWSSTIFSINSRHLTIRSSEAMTGSLARATGASVRCIKDYDEMGTIPSVTTSVVTDISATAAKSGGEVTGDGGAAVNLRGVVWSTEENPSLQAGGNDGYTENGTGTGEFTSELTGLDPGTIYYIRAYATNISGTAYGNELEFKTLMSAPGADFSADVTSGETPLIVRFTDQSINIPDSWDWDFGDGNTSVEQNPEHTYTDAGTYSVTLTATNEGGSDTETKTDYITVNPAPNPPIVTTAGMFNIAAHSATSGGEVTDDGGGEVSAFGIVWATYENPTLQSNEGVTSDCSGNAAGFTCELTGLDPGTFYYVRAYATNSAGTAYGDQVSFRTYDGTVSDIDGNTYGTVIIGDQEWMAHNLRVTSYRDGSSIPTGLNNSQWENTTNGAYAVYPHGSISGLESATEVMEAYGALYNWYALDDNRGLCPSGWRVPCHDDWTQLEQYICNEVGNTGCDTKFPYDNTTTGWRGNNEGNSLKSCRQVSSPLDGECATPDHPRWDSHGTHYGNDDFNFYALPGGTRSGIGNYTTIGSMGYFWSSTEVSSTHAWQRNIFNDQGGVARGHYPKAAGISLRCVKGDIPTLTTTEVTNITATSATSGGEVTDDGGAEVTARGVVWSITENPSLEVGEHDGFTEDGEGTGTFVSEFTGLDPGTTYYVRAYATNSVGTAYGGQVEFETGTEGGFACGDDVTFTYRSATVTYGSVENTTTGKCWLDRNLGASRVATAYNDSDAYGDLFQWGRLDDGHQDRGSGTTSTRSSSDSPGHSSFITHTASPYDWRSTQNDNLWQGDGGINDVCPAGWRVPTETELNNERLSWSSNDYNGAFTSPLKLVAGGYRHLDGSLYNVGSVGGYWSSSVSGSYARDLVFSSSSAGMGSNGRVNGRSVRCTRDD